MKKNKGICDLKSCFLCKGCIPEWLPFVADHKTNQHFSRGEKIFREGEKIEGIYFLFKGKVKVHKQWNNEKELIIRFVKEGDILGHRGFGSTGTYPVSATALEETRVCYVDAKFFQTTLKTNHELAYKLMLFYATELQDAERRMLDLVHMDTKGKVSDALLMMKSQFGCDKHGFIEMNLTRQDLSSFVGTTYETVFRVINELILAKSILIKGKNIKILDEIKLRSYTSPGRIKK